MDDGVSRDSIETNNYDHVTFQCTLTHFTIEAVCLFENPDPLNISQVIHEIRILGFPQRDVESIISSDPNFPSPEFRLDGEDGILRIYNLNLNWCTTPDITFSWNLADPE